MDFLKFSILYAYLYSPKNWLHRQNSITKIYIFLINLVCLPYMPIKYVIVVCIGLISMFTYIYIPIKLSRYFYSIIFIFIFFILINIQQKSQIIPQLLLNRHYVQIYPQGNYFINSNQNQDISFNQSYHLPVSLLRLLSINLIYLFLMKLFLMTTNYEKIIRTYLHLFCKYINRPNQHLTFEVQVANQFLKIILSQVEIVRTTYVIRSIQCKRRRISRKKLCVYLFCVQQLIANIYNSINYISDTLYSREVHKRNLNIICKRQ